MAVTLTVFLWLYCVCQWYHVALRICCLFAENVNKYVS